MNIISTAVYVGPNVYAPIPLIRLVIQLDQRYLDAIQEMGSTVYETIENDLTTFKSAQTEKNTESINLVHSAPSENIGTFIGLVAVHLQRLVGISGDTAFATYQKENRTEILYSYESEDIGIEAGEVACDMLVALAKGHINGTAVDLSEDIKAFIRYADRLALGPSAMALVQAAEARNIPWARLNDASLIQVGQGKYQKRIEAALTSQTSHIAVEIASDKNTCNELLASLGLPVPRQAVVYDEDEAIDEALRMRFPVVLKPLDGNHGRGVTVNVNSEEEVKVAFETAVKEGSAVLVESMLYGDDHRLLVVNGQLIAAARRVPGHVVGDGTHTIAELVEIVNQDPRRGVGHENMLTKIELDKQALALIAEKAYQVDTVLAEGEVLYLRKTANISTGGTAIDVTDTIHPDNKLMAERAIRAVGLDIGAVDFLTTDITKSYRDIGGGICEVNAGPGLRMHIAPSEGKPRDVGGAIMDMLFPQGSESRIPIAAITGTNGKTTCSRMLAHILKMAGHVVGQTSTDAVYIDGNVTVKGDMTGPVSAQMVLSDPTVDIAVLETARGGIVRSGLGYQFCDVGAVINVSSDHLGLGGVETVDELAEVKRVIPSITRDTVVLNADNEYTLKMASFSPAKHIMYVTSKPENKLVREHIRLGKRAVVLEKGVNGDQIVIYENGTQIPLIWTHVIPATLEGKAIHNVENAMFAAGMAYALGKNLDQIRIGLRTFDNTFFQSPGRMNVFDKHGFRVILDYGHNEAAIGAMTDLVNRLNPRGRRLLGVTCPGDRRDQDIVAIAQRVAGHFDEYYCHRDDDLRGRAPDETPKIMRDALIQFGVPEDKIHIVEEEEHSLDAVLNEAREDDLVLFFCENITRTWKQIVNFIPAFQTNETTQTHSAISEIELDIPEGFQVVSDERGVLILPKG